uniref:HTH La-type RNA-binding domain-containing protein n=1 Tax=Acrobeloides nanus TaxID=290746 RepID=A0A914EC36_9BILA
MKQLCDDTEQPANALQDSLLIEVSNDSTKIRRYLEFPLLDVSHEYWWEVNICFKTNEENLAVKIWEAVKKTSHDGKVRLEGAELEAKVLDGEEELNTIRFKEEYNCCVRKKLSHRGRS